MPQTNKPRELGQNICVASGCVLAILYQTDPDLSTS